MKRYFMSIREACNLVIQSSALQLKDKIFILEMGEQIKIIDLVKKMLDFFEKDFRDYKIKHIGPRKGEKNSEILSYTRKSIKTKIKKLMISNEKIRKIKFLDSKIEKIEKYIIDNDSSNALLEIKKIIKV